MKSIICAWILLLQSAVKPNIVLAMYQVYVMIQLVENAKINSHLQNIQRNILTTTVRETRIINGLMGGIFYGLNANYTESLLTNQTPSVLIERLSDKATNYQIGVFSDNGFKTKFVPPINLFHNIS